MFRYPLMQISAILLLATHTMAEHVADLTGRSIPEGSLAYPVLITLSKGGVGSGFYLSDYRYVYLITAAHVIFDSTGSLNGDHARLMSYAQGPKDHGRIHMQLNLRQLENAGRVLRHRRHDIAAIVLGSSTSGKVPGTYEMRGSPEISIIDSTVTGPQMALMSSLKKFEEVVIANDIFIFGYPVSLGIKQIPQIDYQRPLLRRGVVAGINTELSTIIIDCPAYPGNSGGPVMQVDPVSATDYKFKIIGVVTEFIPFVQKVREGCWWQEESTIWANSGYAVVEPMDAVFELTATFK